MTRWCVLACALAALAAAGVLVSETRPAVACTPAELSLEEQAELADVVVVGEVVDAPEGEAGSHSIRVAAALKGDPRSWLEMTPQTQCWDPTKLEQGRQLLLFVGLQHRPGSYDSTVFDARYVLADHQFQREYFGSPGPVLSPEEALQRVAAVTGASPNAVAAGIDFAEGRTSFAQPSDGERRLPWVGLGAAAGAGLLLAGLAAAWRLRRQAC